MHDPVNPESAIPLCPLDAIPDGGAKGVELGEGADYVGIILLRRGDTVHGFLNRCPHQGTPLETFPDRFLDETGNLLVCSTHGARFCAQDGVCVAGPCKGKVLTRVALGLKNGSVTLARDARLPPRQQVAAKPGYGTDED